MSQELPQIHYIKAGEVNTRFWVLENEGSTVVLIHDLRRLPREMG